LDLDLSLDRIERETQIDSLVQNFTEAILEARSLSVHLVRPNRYCLTLTPELKLRISRKNALRRISQRTKNAGQIREFEIHNRLVRDMCVEFGNRAFEANCALWACYFWMLKKRFSLVRGSSPQTSGKRL
jgi:hypothetical protein